MSATTPEPSVTPSPSPSVSPSPSPAPYAFGGGSGTSADPYKIDTATDFDHIVDFPSAVFSVTQDINMNGHTIENGLVDFSGTLRGNGHQLYNVFVVSTGGQDAALFKKVTGTISQLTIDGQFTVNGAGHVAGFATQLGGSISSCRITGTINNTSILSVRSQIVTLAFLSSGARSMTGTTYDVQYNGSQYTGSF